MRRLPWEAKNRITYIIFLGTAAAFMIVGPLGVVKG